MDYYADFVENNSRPGNRHLKASLDQFRKFTKKSRILPLEITENKCNQFRTFLLDRFTGKTPADYFRAFKRAIKSATKEGYFRIHPAEDIMSKTNASKSLKEFLEAEEYISRFYPATWPKPGCIRIWVTRRYWTSPTIRLLLLK